MPRFVLARIPCACLVLVASLQLPAFADPIGTAGPASQDHCASETLCARLGGPQMLRDLAFALVDRSAQDPRTSGHWDRVDLKRVKTKLGEYLCVLTGGSCAYENDDLRTIHAGHHIHSGEFYALVEMLRTELDARGVASREKNELLALLAPAKRDVVEP
jgi:hemoglobin